MILFKKAGELKQYLSGHVLPGQKKGFVPTMGALHEGHISLIERCRQESDLVICSIFVNPAQFNDPADFEKYPITIENDILLLEKAGTDILFLPSVNEIYPNGNPTEHYTLGDIETLLEGRFRPGHFQGVCQVMYRLLKIVEPQLLFMGQKDYQQCIVIQQLLHLMGSSTELVISPTQRESSGLAMSSRNMRLSEKGKETAAAIYQALQWIKAHLQQGTTNDLIQHAGSLLTTAGFDKIDYISIAHAETLVPVDSWDGHTPLVALAAAFLEDVRLIDNLSLN
ncbi:pantoate--beta-alanine ligase [Hydrobacter penzbergensis]|uniref:Pantothenate synthetase n=1 Tax=Hydrobacter penzbergensis TaxID=1235997 RepID=A0A8X8LE69_9BACT|nr:pantoate--beta-alanine ligase [Hydrobacter penzbergensis]SDW48032.1 pantoate--beta-alanine ligase [Hydrobacter penzbergensis]